MLLTLKRADIGVVGRKVPQMWLKKLRTLILLDNNFRTVVAAVEEGRTIFQ